MTGEIVNNGWTVDDLVRESTGHPLLALQHPDQLPNQPVRGQVLVRSEGSARGHSALAGASHVCTPSSRPDHKQVCVTRRVEQRLARVGVDASDSTSTIG